MAVSFISLILVALFVFGVIAAFIALVALAIAKGRGGVALVTGGLAFLGLMIVAIMLSMFLGFSTVRRQSPAINTYENAIHAPVEWEHRELVAPPLTVTTDHTWAIGLSTMAFIVVGIGVLLAYAGRHGHAHAAAANHHRAWPLGLGLVVLGFLLFGGLRYESSKHHSVSTQRAQATARMQQIGAAHRQPRIAAHSAATETAVEPAKNSDIHASMDEFDKPRIPLSESVPPPTSSAELLGAADATLSNAASTKAPEGGDSKSASSSKQKRPAKSATASTERRPANESELWADAPSPTPAKEAKSAGSAIPKAAQTVATVRPAWVDSMPVRTRELQREVIVTEEYESMDECYRAADVYLMLKAYERVQQLTGSPYVTQNLPSITFRDNLMLADGQIVYVMDDGTWSDSRLSHISRMGVTPNFLRSEIVYTDPSTGQLHEYIENSSRSFGPMKRLHTQIEFTPAVDSELMRRWDAKVREDRFAYVGLGAGSVLGLLGMVWGLLKFDTATRGYYTKRLFIGVPAVIIGGFLALLLAVIS